MQKFESDVDILQKNYRFIRNSDNDDSNDEEEEKKEVIDELTKNYEEKLYKEYVLADLTKYKEGQIGLRWRTEKEVLNEKGTKICGNINCNETKNLECMQVNFSYKENNEFKQCLVKINCCKKCTKRMNRVYKKRKTEKEEKKEKSKKKKLKKELKELEKLKSELQQQKKGEEQN